MTPDEEPRPETGAPEASGLSSAPRRGRRSGRGRRGRGRGRRPPPAPGGQSYSSEPPPAEALNEEAAVQAEEGSPSAEFPAPPAPPETEVHAPRERRPAEPAAVQQAIEEVTQIIQTLRETLDEMEGVLETLELAERQQHADEHEIESLRRALRQLHHPRDGGHHRPGR